ncbi:MAG: hypothetical protein H8D34_09365, partial [Chloroflexi bacterium]|nr:hypothetical protein [Chloroflexota bacterium]
FESFLNIAADDQANILAQLAGQANLYLAFYANNLMFQFSKIIPHDIQQWQLLDEIFTEAYQYWESLPVDIRDFDQAKETFTQISF